MVGAQETAPALLAIFEKSKHFRLADFDKRAAIEHAARQTERKRSNLVSPAPTRAKAKFDDQIVAIATVAGASIVYSDDPHIKKLADARFEVKGIAELPLPPANPQGRRRLLDL